MDTDGQDGRLKAVATVLHFCGDEMRGDTNLSEMASILNIIIARSCPLWWVTGYLLLSHQPH